ncbi:hypothetical protein BST61_g1941 [Cercospora zeina]
MTRSTVLVTHGAELPHTHTRAHGCATIQSPSVPACPFPSDLSEFPFLLLVRFLLSLRAGSLVPPLYIPFHTHHSTKH